MDNSDICAAIESLELRCNQLEEQNLIFFTQIDRLTTQVKNLEMLAPLPTTTKRKAGA